MTSYVSVVVHAPSPKHSAVLPIVSLKVSPVTTRPSGPLPG
jgi:hypothetical protein